MTKISRKDIHIISRYSNLSEQGVESALKENVYASKEDWMKFLRLFLITLGIGFTVAGIVFFFAYNWAELNKFIKMGLTHALLMASALLALLPRINLTIRKILLTGSAVLVGVVFAVFGQIYQTGANAYDFFLAWTVFVTLWVIVSNFTPLWLIYLLLINTTFILYAQQVANDWSEVFVFAVLFFVNTSTVLISNLLVKYWKIPTVPTWFINTVALAAVSYATLGIVFGIFGRFQVAFPILIVMTLVVYALGIWHGLKARSGFFLSIIPFSLIIIISSVLIDVIGGDDMFLLVGLFIVSSITFLIKKLIDLQRAWANEERG